MFIVDTNWKYSHHSSTAEVFKKLGHVYNGIPQSNEKLLLPTHGKRKRQHRPRSNTKNEYTTR
jgi:hypothetical protein